MPFSRPTLTQLRAQAAADIASNLPGADALLRFSNLGVLGQVLAAMANGHYGFLDWIAQQAVPFTATGEFLEGWAALKGVIRSPATPATGSATFAGVNGSVVPAGTNAVRGDGETYVTTADATVAGGFVTPPFTDTTPGSAGNCAAGVVLTLGSAVPGVQSGGVTAGPFTGGSDVQTDAQLRTQMLQAYAAPAQGGDLADYVTWALAVPGVTRAWNAGTAPGEGKVLVYFMMDSSESAYGGFPQGTNGVAANETRDTPATGDQLAVANYIYPIRPVTALVYAAAPIANPIALTIAGISGASTTVKSAIAAAFATAILDQAAPGGVTDSQGNPIGQVDLSYIEAAIAQVAGTAGFVITSVSCPFGTVTPGGDGNITSNSCYLATAGVITYV